MTSWVVANIELGQEILWPWSFCFMEEPHHVCPLLPHFDSFLQFHLSLHSEGRGLQSKWSSERNTTLKARILLSALTLTRLTLGK